MATDDEDWTTFESPASGALPPPTVEPLPPPPPPKPPERRFLGQPLRTWKIGLAVGVPCVVVVGALALTDNGDDGGVPRQVQRVCADYIIAADDWQNGRTTDAEFRNKLLRLASDSRDTEVGDAFDNAEIEFTGAMTTGDPSSALVVLRGLGTRCGNLLPD